jgi:hypothetical protein
MVAARFSGRNGRFLNDLIKQNKIKFERFPEQSLRLGRFDLNYSYILMHQIFLEGVI